MISAWRSTASADRRSAPVSASTSGATARAGNAAPGSAYQTWRAPPGGGADPTAPPPWGCRSHRRNGGAPPPEGARTRGGVGLRRRVVVAAMEAPPGGGADGSPNSPGLTRKNAERFERWWPEAPARWAAVRLSRSNRPPSAGCERHPGANAPPERSHRPRQGSTYTIIAPPAGGSTCLVPMNSNAVAPRVSGSPRSMNATESTR